MKSSTQGTKSRGSQRTSAAAIRPSPFIFFLGHLDSHTLQSGSQALLRKARRLCPASRPSGTSQDVLGGPTSKTHSGQSRNSLCFRGRFSQANFSFYLMGKVEFTGSSGGEGWGVAVADSTNKYRKTSPGAAIVLSTMTGPEERFF